MDPRRRRRRWTSLVAGLAAAWLAAGSPSQGPGDLDPTFGTNGRLSIDLGGNDPASSLFLLPDGRMLLAGSGESNHELIALRRLADGSPDPSFGTDGGFFADFGGVDVGYDAALTPDGKLVVVGTSFSGPVTYIVVLRRNADGSQDNTRLDGDGQPAGATPGGGGAGGAPGGPAPGTAIPRCAGRKATIVGTARRDVRRGTRRRDVIAGLAGDDVIRGLGGDDVICGGPGADTILGGPGADRLLGQAGRDALDGGAGRDILGGGAGRDRCAGGAGLDRAACERSRTL